MGLPQDNANGYRVSMVSYCRPVLKVLFPLKRMSTWRKIQCLYSNPMSNNLFAFWLFGQLRNVQFFIPFALFSGHVPSLKGCQLF